MNELAKDAKKMRAIVLWRMIELAANRQLFHDVRVDVGD